MSKYSEEEEKMRTPAKLRELWSAHVRRYTGMYERAQRGEPGYRADELRDLLKAWESVRLADFVYAQIPALALGEVYDAIADALGDRGIYADEPDDDELFEQAEGEPISGGAYQGRAVNRPFN